jgi:hypothetical protein
MNLLRHFPHSTLLAETTPLLLVPALEVRTATALQRFHLLTTDHISLMIPMNFESQLLHIETFIR